MNGYIYIYKLKYAHLETNPENYNKVGKILYLYSAIYNMVQHLVGSNPPPDTSVKFNVVEKNISIAPNYCKYSTY